MPRYRVTIPFYTRAVEVHYITADSEDDAVDQARGSDPSSVEDDYAYYEVEKGGIEIEKVSSDTEDLAECASGEE